MSNKQLTLSETLAADRVLAAAEVSNYGVIDFDPAAARNVDLPAAPFPDAPPRALLHRSSEKILHLDLPAVAGVLIAADKDADAGIRFVDGGQRENQLVIAVRLGIEIGDAVFIDRDVQKIPF